MGDWTGTVPTYASGDEVPASKMQTETAIDTALTSSWGPWTSTLTNLTLGSGSVISKYRRLGSGSIDYRFKFSLGAGSAVGTSPKFTLPSAPVIDYVDASGSAFPIGTAFLVQTGVATRMGLAVVLTGTTATIFFNNPTTGEAESTITATAPWTWASGHQIHVWGSYEPA